jgi:predicted polyphosphate/ATP-dependent NAD kinase
MGLSGCVGIIANPMSGRDIRRVTARASVFPNAEKASMVLRLIAAAGALGVDRVLVSTDSFGIAAAVLRACRRRPNGRDAAGWPEVRFCEPDPPTGTAEDTRALVRQMRAAGAGVLVLLGGDGTVRAAASELNDTPVLPLSTGTNNAFPQLWEATVAGIAASLVATGRIDDRGASYRAKLLRVDAPAGTEVALVDVCVCTLGHVAAKALWQPATLRALFCTFAEPHAIGLSSIAGQLRPTARDHPGGVAVRLASAARAERTVLAPVAPGRLEPVGVLAVEDLAIGESRLVDLPAGTIALDGEREIEFGPGDQVRVTLTDAGPRVLDIPRVLAEAASRRLLTTAVAIPAAP